MKRIALFLLLALNASAAEISVRTAAGDSKDLQNWMGDPATAFPLVYSDSRCDEKPCISLPAEMMEAARYAWENLHKTMRYYREQHGLESLDGRGGELRAITFFDGTHHRYNAHWDEEKGFMVFGRGNDSRYYSFSRPLDITAHELTHALITHTAHLSEHGESGALNESYADVFGKLVEIYDTGKEDWLVAHRLYKDPRGFLRDMEHPEISHVKDQLYKNQPCGLRNDYCAVHKNNGIPNRAAVLLVKAIGPEKVGKIYFLALTKFLRSDSNFHDARAMTEKACAELYGAKNPACGEVAKAFAAVGVY